MGSLSFVPNTAYLLGQKSETKSCFFERVDKIDNPWPGSPWGKERGLKETKYEMKEEK